MPEVRYGGKNGTTVRLREDPDLVVVRTRSRRSLRAGVVPGPAAEAVRDLDVVASFPDAGVEVYRRGQGARDAREVVETLAGGDDIRFAGSGLVEEESGEPTVYTENLFVKFTDDTPPDECARLLSEHGLVVKETPSYATNAYVAAAPEGTGRMVFDIAENLLALPEVELCHPELIQRSRNRTVFPAQWHLRPTTINGVDVNADANVEAAHTLSVGAGVVIAVLDDGFDLGHPEFASPNKIVAPRDFAPRTIDDDPSPGPGQNHGTACAGVACGEGQDGASGVAPRAKLLPIRMPNGIGSVREADAFTWAADHGADVISCSWGPPDGDWWDPTDPLHHQPAPIPDHTRLAIERAATLGRDGKGCLVLFAAGNGNESVDLDGYASHPHVLAIAACNDRSRRSVYSDFGAAVLCSFPSNDFAWPQQGRPNPLTSGIWTSDRRGRDGYNRGSAANGDPAGNYTNSFGGTSSACPGAAGVAALVISRNPALRADEVRAVLRRACVRIDPQGGEYDTNGWSPWYGYGRLDARTAVELARPSVVPPRVSVSRTVNEPILNLATSRVELVVGEEIQIDDLRVGIDVTHASTSDLVITLEPPTALGIAPITLHDRTGGSCGDLVRNYDVNTTPALAGCRGKGSKGKWLLVVEDTAAADTGRIRGFGVEITQRFDQHDGRIIERGSQPKRRTAPDRVPSRRT